MKTPPEKLAEWKALVHKLNNDADDHMGVAHSTDMPPQHTVNFRHAKNAHEAAWAITNLIADLEEARRRSLISEAFAKELSSELISTRKQLAEAQARNAQVLSVAEKMRCAGGAQEFQHWFDELKLFLLRKPDTSALDAAIAEAVESYRKDAERWKELLSRLGDDSGPTIVKIEGWSDEYPGYAWFADLTQEQVIAELDTAIAAKGESK